MSKLTASCKTGSFFYVELHVFALTVSCMHADWWHVNFVKAQNLVWWKWKHVRFVHEWSFFKRDSVISTNFVFFLVFFFN